MYRYGIYSTDRWKEREGKTRWLPGIKEIVSISGIAGIQAENQDQIIEGIRELVSKITIDINKGFSHEGLSTTEIADSASYPKNPSFQVQGYIVSGRTDPFPQKPQQISAGQMHITPRKKDDSEHPKFEPLEVNIDFELPLDRKYTDSTKHALETFRKSLVGINTLINGEGYIRYLKRNSGRDSLRPKGRTGVKMLKDLTGVDYSNIDLFEANL